MEADRGLAGARPALDDEETLGLARDQAVLVGLDRRDDVAHVLVAAALELFEQDVGDAVDDLARGAVQRLVVELEQLPSVDAEAPAQRDAQRLGHRRGVERPRRRRLPVDDERCVVLVHPAATDVERRVEAVEVEPAEAEAAVRVLERVEPAPRPRLEPGRLVLGRVDRLADALELSLHPLDAVVGVVDVRLLGGQIRVR